MTSDKGDPQPPNDRGPTPSHLQDTGPNLMAKALRCARRGWHLFPVHSIRDDACTCSNGRDCGSSGKHPRTTNGVKDATTDLGTIRDWWRRWPDANIGIATGESSGLVVLDIDPRHGGDNSLEALIHRHGPLPDTVEVMTGGSGVHVYFAYDGVEAIRNSTSVLGPGLDIKTDGGYVVAPPSMHVSGGRYAWEESSRPEATDLAPPPQWLVGALTARDEDRSTPDGSANGNGTVDPVTVLAGVPEGERNAALFRFSSRHRGLGLGREEATELAFIAAAACAPPLPDAEARRIVANVYSRYEAGRDVSHAVPGPASLDSATARFTIFWGNKVEDLPTPEWLIDDIITKGSFAVLYGAPGVGKTFAALDLAGAVASGQRWQGHVTLKGPVVYVAAEGVGDLGLRHEALRIGRCLDDLPDLGYITEPVNLYLDHDIGYLLDLLDGRAPALIVFDTLARSMDGGDESFAKDMNAVIKHVDRIRHETGAAVMLLHHPGHDKSRERGSTALRGAADVFIRLTADATSTVTLRCDKMKMAQPFEDFSIRFEKTGRSLAVVSRGVTPTLTESERACVTLVSADALTHKAWLEAFEKAGHGSKSKFERAIRALRGKAFVDGGGGPSKNQYTITDAGREALGVTGINEVSGDE